MNVILLANDLNAIFREVHFGADLSREGGVLITYKDSLMAKGLCKGTQVNGAIMIDDPKGGNPFRCIFFFKGGRYYFENLFQIVGLVVGCYPKIAKKQFVSRYVKEMNGDGLRLMTIPKFYAPIDPFYFPDSSGGFACSSLKVA